MSNIIHAIEGVTEHATVKDTLIKPNAVESAFGYVYVGVSGDVIRSAGGKENWITEGAGLIGVVTAMKNHTDGYLYAATDLGYLYRKNTFNGIWTAVGSTVSTRIHDIASVSGDDIYLAGENGNVYTSDGTAFANDYTTGETSVKGVTAWDNKVYASTTGSKIFAKDNSWWLQKTLSGDNIGYVWRLREYNGKLTGVGDNGVFYTHDGFKWRGQKISNNAILGYSTYLDKAVVSDASGDMYFLESNRWKKKHTFSKTINLREHKGAIIAVVSGDDLVKRVNYVLVEEFEQWQEESPSRLSIVESVKRDGGISDKRQYNSLASINISGITHKGDYDSLETRFQQIQQSVDRNEFKLWFEDDKFRYVRKSSLSKVPFKPGTIMSFNLSMVGADPYRYSNKKKFQYSNLSWADEVTNISQTSGDTSIPVGNLSSQAVKQTFRARQSTISKLFVKSGVSTGVPSGDIVFKLRDASDTVLKSATIGSGDWLPETELNVSFNYPTLTIGALYNVYISGDQSVDSNNYRTVSGAKLSNAYQGGHYSQASGDTFTAVTSGDLYFKINNCEKSVVLTNAGNGYASPRITMTAESGDLINSRISNTDANAEVSYHKFTTNIVQGGRVVFDTEKRRIASGLDNAFDFFTGDFLELSPGENTLKFQSPPARFEIEYRDTYL